MTKESSVRYPSSGALTSRLLIALALTLYLSGCSSSSLSPSHSASANANATLPTGAVAGYVWDSRVRGLRPVIGTLGAASLERPVAGPAFRSAAPCPSHGFALAADATGSIIAIVLPSGQAAKVGDAVAADQQIALSPTCSDGLVYSPSRGSGLLISGLPSSSRAQTLTMSAPGSLNGAAVSDSGAILLAVTKSDGTTLLKILSPTGVAETLSTSLQKVGGIAFLPGTDSAIVADSAANTVYLGKQLSSGPSFTTIAAAAQGVLNPRAVAASADGHFAFVANGAGNSLLRVDLTSNAAPLPIACRCSPTELIPLDGNSFQITDPAAGVIFALNGGGQIPRTVFIPTDKVSAATGGAQ